MKNGVLFNGTELTGSFVYSDAIEHGEDKIELHVIYDPDEGASSGRGADLILQVADVNSPATADWIQVGEISSSTGVLTFTPRDLLILTTGAGTLKKAIWSETVQGRYFRVGIKEAAVSSDYGNITVTYYTRKA